MLQGYRDDMTTCPIDPEVSRQRHAAVPFWVLLTPAVASDE